MTNERFVVEHQPARSRYALIDRGEDGASSSTIGSAGYVDFDGTDGNERIFASTFVKPEYGGHGLASVLVKHVFDDTVAAGGKIVPVCPYVVAWVPKHPEYEAHSITATPAHLAALPPRD